MVIPAAPSAQWSAGVPENRSTGGLLTSSGLVTPGRDTVGAAWAVVVTAGFVAARARGWCRDGGAKRSHANTPPPTRTTATSASDARKRVSFLRWAFFSASRAATRRSSGDDSLFPPAPSGMAEIEHRKNCRNGTLVSRLGVRTQLTDQLHIHLGHVAQVGDRPYRLGAVAPTSRRP